MAETSGWEVFEADSVSPVFCGGQLAPSRRQSYARLRGGVMVAAPLEEPNETKLVALA